MKKDFHYDVIYFLAKHAGFNEKDAFTIAYSSQFVDDQVQNYDLMVDGKEFVQILTAHKLLDQSNIRIEKGKGVRSEELYIRIAVS
jgi:hypothetical protein